MTTLPSNREQARCEYLKVECGALYVCTCLSLLYVLVMHSYCILGVHSRYRAIFTIHKQTWIYLVMHRLRWHDSQID